MTCTYRFRRSDRSLVYVGVTDDLEARLKAHAKRTWWPEVAATDVIWFDNRLDALYEESRAIAEEAPTYNEREGLSPFGFKPITRCGWETAVTRSDKDALVATLRRKAGAAQVTYYGELTGAVIVSPAWYARAKQRMGEAVDLESMRGLSIDGC